MRESSAFLTEPVSLNASFQQGAKERSVEYVPEDGGMQVCVCVCWCIILLVCFYDCEHKICSACRKRLAGLCDDSTIKVSTVDIPVWTNHLSVAMHR